MDWDFRNAMGVEKKKLIFQSFFNFFSNFLTKQETIKIKIKYSNIKKVYISKGLYVVTTNSLAFLVKSPIPIIETNDDIFKTQTNWLPIAGKIFFIA